MTQKEIYAKSLEIEKMKEELTTSYKNFGKQFIGKNLKDVFDEIMSTQNTIYVVRGNVTFIHHYPKRRKRPQIEIDKNRTRQNLICKNNNYFEKLVEFHTTIKDVYVSNEPCNDNEIVDKITCIPTLYFVLDDSEEFVVDLK